MKLRTLIAGLAASGALAVGGAAYAQSRVCAPTPRESVPVGTETLTPAALEAMIFTDGACVKPVFKIGTVNLEACVPGQKNCVPCTPGAKYPLPTLGSDDVVTFHCPDQKPVAGKSSCLSQFGKHGFCLDDNLAGAFGLTERVEGYCTGTNTHCYNATKAKPFVNVDDLKKVSDKVEGLTARVDKTEKAVRDAQLSDLESFALSLLGDQCKGDYNRLKGMLAGVKEAETARDAAAGGLKVCLEKVQPGDRAVPEGKKLIEYARQEKVSVCPAESAALIDKDEAYKTAFGNFKTAVDFVKDHGCNYKPPQLVKKQPVQFDLFAKGVYAFGNGAKAFGAEAELQVTGALDENGVARLGGYANTGYAHRIAHSETKDDLDFATQITTETRTIDRLVGAGAVLKVRAAPKDYLVVDFKAGGAAKKTTMERTTAIAEKSRSVFRTSYDFVGEVGVGVTTGYTGKSGRWSIRVGPEFRVDTQKDMGVMGVLGIYWK